MKWTATCCSATTTLTAAILCIASHAHAQVTSQSCGTTGPAVTSCLTVTQTTSNDTGEAAITAQNTGDGYGLYAETSGASAVYAVANGNASAIYAENTSGAGIGIIGIGNTAPGIRGNSNSAAGVYGIGTVGVYGTTNSTNGVYGGQFLSTQNDGVHADCQVNGHAAVSGTCDAPFNCDGIYGNSDAPYPTSGAPTYGGVVGNNTSTGPGGIFTSAEGTYSAYFAEDINIAGTAYGPSDARLKKNVRPIANAVDQLLRLRGVTYEWKEPEKHSHASGTQIGFIAQDVEQVFPGWVHTDEGGFKSLSMTQVEGLEVESIRTLKAENDELRERVKALESGRRPMVSGFGEGFIGLGMAAIAGAIVFTSLRRKRAESAKEAGTHRPC